MKFRLVIITASTLATLLMPAAYAGCGDVSTLSAPFQVVSGRSVPSIKATRAEASHNGETASVVGMWSIQFISKGNTSLNPPIPDGALVDFGYV